jgi:hypothetical protein
MKMSKHYFWLLQSLFVLFIACTNDDLDADAIYLSYQLTGQEDDSVIVLKLQYKRGGPNGPSILLEKPGKVELDGVEIPPDSTRIGGTYYEVIGSIESFQGTHSLVFTAPDGKKYREEFTFEPMRLKVPLGDTIQREGLNIPLQGVKDGDQVRLIVTDSSFGELEINRLDTVRDGKVRINKQEWDILFNGPIHLEIYTEINRQLANPTRRGGQLSISYALKRDMILVE